jgi:cytochrome d ubiquinol oxidase subunit II
MIILLAFVIQAVSYEFRSKPGNVFGHHVYERLLYINGLVGTLLTGTAVATFFTGSSFFVSEMNQPEWKSSFHGLELAFDLTRYETYINLSLGLAVFFLSRILGTLYILNSVDDMLIVERSKRHLKINGMAFLFFFAFFTVNLLLLNGYAYDPVTGAVYRQPFKYLHNFLEMPYLLLLLLTGAFLVVFPLWMSRKRFSHFAPKAIWYAGPGTILVVFSLMLCAGLNETAFYPSYYDLQSSLTIRNASSSHYTLAAMGYVSLLVPFVAAYIWYAWRAINRKKIDAKEMDEETHTY